MTRAAVAALRPKRLQISVKTRLVELPMFNFEVIVRNRSEPMGAQQNHRVAPSSLK